MIFKKQKTAQQKRLELKQKIESSYGLRFVGSFSPLVSRLIEKKGFDGIYVSGAVLSSFQALPDIGLSTLTELAQFSELVTRFCDLASLIDADTGFGETCNVARTVDELEKRGLSACHIEDQKFPKRCGHLDNKSLIPKEDMIQKIKTAVKARSDKNFLIIARTDARGVEGLESAVDRAKAYQLAGADMIFPEALESIEEFRYFRSKISAPLMANMTEFGKSDIISHKEFCSLKYNLILYPVSVWRLALKAVDQGLDLLAKDQQAQLLPKMQSRKELYELLQYEDYKKWDKDIYNFSLKKE